MREGKLQHGELRKISNFLFAPCPQGELLTPTSQLSGREQTQLGQTETFLINKNFRRKKEFLARSAEKCRSCWCTQGSMVEIYNYEYIHS
jgi:hypothetical protein